MHTIEKCDDGNYMVCLRGPKGAWADLVWFSDCDDAMAFCNYLNGGPKLDLSKQGAKDLEAQWPA
jgi:hypothetical protein